MGTVVALESQDGVVIAADSQAVTGETVTSQSVERILDFDDIGAGVVGDTSDIQEFRRQLKSEIQGLRVDQGDNVEIDKLARIAARHAKSANIAAVVATHNSDGAARLRQVDSDGGVLDTTSTAIGSGAEIALGQLETVSSDVKIDEAKSIVSDALETVGERDANSGGEITCWSLRNSGDDKNKVE
jgi:20S proteasome alpha/beta subunit